MTTEEGLLAAVVADPADDLPRLVLADWLEENGQPERAEFIHLAVEVERLGGYYGACKVAHPNAVVGCGSCEACKITRRMDELIEDGDRHDITAGWQIAPVWAWSYRDHEQVALCPEAVIRRGFVAEVRCRLTDWCGTTCERCHVAPEWYGDSGRCPLCWQDGLPPGIGPEVVRRHPVERVVLTDREPQHTPGGHTTYWRRLEDVPDEHRQHQSPNLVPAAVFDLMEGGEVNLPTARWGYVANVAFPTREDALAALSDALLAWARDVSVRHLAL